MTFHQVEIGELFDFNRNFMVKVSAFKSRCVDVYSSWYAFGESGLNNPDDDVVKISPVQFSDIPAGKMFLVNGIVYLTAVNGEDKWGVEFLTGKLTSIPLDSLVFPIH